MWTFLNVKLLLFIFNKRKTWNYQKHSERIEIVLDLWIFVNVLIVYWNYLSVSQYLLICLLHDNLHKIKKKRYFRSLIIEMLFIDKNFQNLVDIISQTPIKNKIWTILAPILFTFNIQLVYNLKTGSRLERNISCFK